MSGIYIASKVVHAKRWVRYRDSLRFPLISSWIDEAGVGESNSLSYLWHRCIIEAHTAPVLVIYREKDEILKGAWVELGANLAGGGMVYAVGIEEFTISNHHHIVPCDHIDEAMVQARDYFNTYITRRVR